MRMLMTSCLADGTLSSRQRRRSPPPSMQRSAHVTAYNSHNINKEEESETECHIRDNKWLVTHLDGKEVLAVEDCDGEDDMEFVMVDLVA